MAAAEDEQQRPTYFELTAAEGLVPSLKAALSYSLSVRSRRRSVPADRRLTWLVSP